MAKTALITGSTSGIGLATAKAFAAKGYNIVFNGLEENGAEIAASVAKEYNVDYIFSPANMLKPEEIKQLATEALAKFGSIEVLMNNAGIQFVSPIEDFPDDKWDAIIAINLTAAFHLTKAILPSMKANKFGRIINISSAHGLIASPFKSAYVAAKHGIIGLTKVTALEGGEFGITCNAICPGYVHTPIVDKQIPDQMKAHNMTKEEVINKVFLAEHAIKDFISVETIAESILFLADSAAAATITGIALPLDAGWTAH
ncbi:3-hydroxybutyrate dehydrogenase [Taibaiella lutea]|uniref:3-hydroxybutyrate dehydrogenase n=1 Tax=Taibaiella lutea TaxID=2608001 RepID=A0A5M6CUR5_9BACT|nr:3-hydroxybutyrate dehydrogenase [Taibaiella lutea]KAA5536929.1 3-hydroxybutyrate dehydrogenase [Taibaiella lutea]